MRLVRCDKEKSKLHHNQITKYKIAIETILTSLCLRIFAVRDTQEAGERIMSLDQITSQAFNISLCQWQSLGPFNDSLLHPVGYRMTMIICNMHIAHAE